MFREESPSATTRQICGHDGEGRAILSVLTKRTYRILDDGGCQLAEPQPLVEEAITDLANKFLLAWDSDLFPYKRATDFVVKGHVANPRGLPEIDAAVLVGAHAKRLRVTGDRRCMVTSGGKLIFSRPASFATMPLTYSRAYGGRDAVAEKKYGNPWLNYAPYLGPPPPDLDGASPYLYPRNLAGVGYLIEANSEAVDALQLPNFEDPLDRLTPERLVVGDPGRWTTMPMPAGTDWCDYAWFPRIAYAGMVPDADPPDGPVPEIVRGLVAPDILNDKEVADSVDVRLANGASLGLQLPYVRPAEMVRLEGLHPIKPSFTFRLPAESPAIFTDGRQGRLNPTAPVIHTVVVEPDDARLTIVWRGCAPAVRLYLPEELKKMPLRIDWADHGR